MTMAHLYAPLPTLKAARRETCPSCNQRSVTVGWYVEWCGWDQTCLRCGERWSDGTRCPRPLERGWRRESIAAARRYFKALKNVNVRWSKYE